MCMCMLQAHPSRGYSAMCMHGCCSAARFWELAEGSRTLLAHHSAVARLHTQGPNGRVRADCAVESCSGQMPDWPAYDGCAMYAADTAFSQMQCNVHAWLLQCLAQISHSVLGIHIHSTHLRMGVMQPILDDRNTLQ